MPWENNEYIPCWKMENEDVWNFSSTLALFIAEGLEKLREMGHGYPAYTTEESWDWQLEHHAKMFRTHATDDEIDITESLLWLAYNYHALWD